jgi:hypothetical protein
MGLNDLSYHNQNSFPFAREDDGKRLVAKGLTGKVMISW